MSLKPNKTAVAGLAVASSCRLELGKLSLRSVLAICIGGQGQFEAVQAVISSNSTNVGDAQIITGLTSRYGTAPDIARETGMTQH